MLEIGYALSGGGAHGAVQAGMMQVLHENGIHPTCGAGTSVGAINGTGWAQWQNPTPLYDLWMDLDNSKVRDSWFLGLLRGFFKGSRYDSAPLKKFLDKHINIELLRETPLYFEVGAVNVTSGKSDSAAVTGAYMQHNWVVDWLMRSSAFPLGLTPVKDAQNQIWLDWGLRDITPLNTAINMGCEQIWVLQCSRPGNLGEYTGGTRMDKLGMRCIDILIDEIHQNDLSGAKAWNAAIKAGSDECKGKWLINLHVIQPWCDPPGDSLDFSPELNAKRYQIGQESAFRYLESLGQGDLIV